MPLRFSIITPSFNSGDTLERAIQSVLVQDYKNFEHIIVDGGSTDGTLEILERYPHLRWISELDEGQVDAMNKGFTMAGGEIIGYLNADDYYLEGAFSAAAEAFDDPEIKMVMGKIRVYSEEYDCWWENDPATDFDRMLRHWEKNAFCVNPVGYFYRKEVQEEIHLNSDNDDKQDLEFLLEVADRFPGGIRKLDRVFGEFINGLNTKTAQEQHRLDYWRPDNFSFLDRFLEKRSPGYQAEFRARQACGYQVRTNWTIKNAIKNGHADEYFEKGDLFQLPAAKIDISSHTVFSENIYPAAVGDSVVVMLSAGKVASQSVIESLRLLPENVFPYPSYHLHIVSDASEEFKNKLQNEPREFLNQLISGHALGCFLKKRGDKFRWKFITGVREPLSQLMSLQYMIYPLSCISSKDDFFRYVDIRWSYVSDYFNQVYRDILGLDIFGIPFDITRGYSIIKKGNVEVLIYKLEMLDNICSEAVGRFLGIPDFILSRFNEAKDKPYNKAYRKALSCLENSFTSEELDRFYSNPIVTHFYSDMEIAGFRKKWGN